MNRWKIRSESLPQRCELCHQSDQFSPQNNTCLRCQNLLTLTLNAVAHLPQNLNYQLPLAPAYLLSTTRDYLSWLRIIFTASLTSLLCYIVLYTSETIDRFNDLLPPPVTSDSGEDFSMWGMIQCGSCGHVDPYESFAFFRFIFVIICIAIAIICLHEHNAKLQATILHSDKRR